MIPHLLRCQGFAVVHYGFTLGRLGPEASSTFAQLRLYEKVLLKRCSYLCGILAVQGIQLFVQRLHGSDQLLDILFARKIYTGRNCF